MSAQLPRDNGAAKPTKESAAVARPTKGLAAIDTWLGPVPGSILLVIITLIVYWPAIHSGFIWDDDTMLTNNPLIFVPHGLWKIWFSTDQADYFPLTYSSLWLEARLGGMWGNGQQLNAMGFHLVNVLLHAFTAGLLWRALKYLRVPGAFFAALIYAVHPVNVESTAWIAERKNTLTMFFFALALLWYLRFETTRIKNPRVQFTGVYWAAVIAFALALLAKTSVVMFPFVVLGCAWWLHGRLTKQDLLHSLPFFGMSLILSLTTIWFQYNRAINVQVVNTNPFQARLAGAGWNVWFYLYKLLLPLKLTFVYPRWEIDWKNALVYLPGVAVFVVLALLWLFRNKIGRAPFLAFAYFVVTLFPVLGFFNIYFFRYSFVADHYQTIAMIGIIALVVGGCIHCLREVGPVILLVVNGGLAFLAWQQCHIYRNQETLWADTLQKNPNCSMAEANWGFYLSDTQHQPETALPHYHASLKIDPNDAGTHYNLAVALVQLKRMSEAVAEFHEALRLKPDHLFSLESLSWIEAVDRDPRIRNPEEALRLARQAVELTHGQDEDKLDILAAALAATGHFDVAVPTEQKAIDLAAQKQTGGIPGMEQRLKLYQMKQTYVEQD